MKLSVFLLFIFLLKSSAVSFLFKVSEQNLKILLQKYLQEKIISLNTIADPEYIILTTKPGNETHFGARTVQLLKKVNQVSITLLAYSRGPKLMMNMTRVICNGKRSIKIAGFVKEMFSLDFDNRDFVEPKCPIEEVSGQSIMFVLS